MSLMKRLHQALVGLTVFLMVASGSAPASAQMLLLGVGRPAAAAASYTTFDSSNSASNALPLTNGNLTVTSTPGAYGISRSIASISGTKRFEIKLENYGSAWRAGIVNGSFGITSSTMGDDSNSIGLIYNGSAWVLRYNGTSTDVSALGFVYNTNDWTGFEVDVPNNKIYLAIGGSRYPSSGLTGLPSGTLYAAVQVGPQDTKYTANFGATSWNTTPQTSGFTGF